jgi:hypothetical protein
MIFFTALKLPFDVLLKGSKSGLLYLINHFFSGFETGHLNFRRWMIGTPTPSLCGYHLYFSHCNYDTSVIKFPGVD